MANLVHDWNVVQEGLKAIERHAGGGSLGPIQGRWVLTQGSVMAGEARYEAGLVFPLCGRTAYLGISALTPSGDSAGGSMGFGEYLVNGSVKPTVWNRDKVLETIKGVSLAGYLPASRVTVSSPGGAILQIRVTDCNRHRVGAQALRLERLSGGKWARVASGTTNNAGNTTVRAPGAGTYRVVAGVAEARRFAFARRQL